MGTDVDVANAYPELADCVLASITKDIEHAVREAIFAYANGTMSPEWRLGLDDGGVASPTSGRASPAFPSTSRSSYAAAEQDVLTGQVETCPGDCGAPIDPAEPGDRVPRTPPRRARRRPGAEPSAGLSAGRRR